MKKKQKKALKILRQRIAEEFGTQELSIADITAYAKTKLKYNVCRMAALLELRKEDFWRFYDTGFQPPYFVNAFRRYFNIKQEQNND